MIRKAVRTLTGRAARIGDVVLGYREDGAPGATLHIHSLPSGAVSVCFTDVAVVSRLMDDLERVQRHMMGGHE